MANTKVNSQSLKSLQQVHAQQSQSLSNHSAQQSATNVLNTQSYAKAAALLQHAQQQSYHSLNQDAYASVFAKAGPKPIVRTDGELVYITSGEHPLTPQEALDLIDSIHQVLIGMRG